MQRKWSELRRSLWWTFQSWWIVLALQVYYSHIYIKFLIKKNVSYYLMLGFRTQFGIWLFDWRNLVGWPKRLWRVDLFWFGIDKVYAFWTCVGVKRRFFVVVAMELDLEVGSWALLMIREISSHHLLPPWLWWFWWNNESMFIRFCKLVLNVRMVVVVSVECKKKK